MEIVAKTTKEVIPYANFDKERFTEEIQSQSGDRQKFNVNFIVNRSVFLYNWDEQE